MNFQYQFTMQWFSGSFIGEGICLYLVRHFLEKWKQVGTKLLDQRISLWHVGSTAGISLVRLLCSSSQGLKCRYWQNFGPTRHKASISISRVRPAHHKALHQLFLACYCQHSDPGRIFSFVTTKPSFLLLIYLHNKYVKSSLLKNK